MLAAADRPGDAATLAAAAEFAAQNDARLAVLACVEPSPDIEGLARATGMSAAQMTGMLVETRRATLVDLARRAGPINAQRIHVTAGKPFVEVSRYVAANAIDLVMKAADRLSGSGRLLFASTDQHLVRKCPCAVWLACRVPGIPR